MIALLRTAERTNSASYINNYVFQRHLFAYKHVLLSKLAGDRVLEIGCGDGYGMGILAPQTESYLAIDKKKPAYFSFNPNVSFLYGNLPYLPGIADNSFDTVICFQVIEHIKDDHALLAEIKRVLKPGGKLFLTTPNKLMSLTRNPFHVREYLPGEMCALMRTHFNDCVVDGIYGKRVVMDYYHENKKGVAAITRYDILDLQHRLPAFVLRPIYSLLNNLNRLSLSIKIKDITADIRFNDFFISSLNNDCLDYFITATKQPEELS